MKTATTTEVTGFWPNRASSPRKRTAATAPFLSAVDQLGGCGTRSPGFFFFERLRARCCASARLRARPRAGRVSMRPPCVPRCLRRRLFLVWAIERRLAENVFDHVTLGIEAADRRLARIAGERLGRGEPDQMGLDRVRAAGGGEPGELGDQRGERNLLRVLDVDRHLAAASLEGQAEGADARQTPARL